MKDKEIIYLARDAHKKAPKDPYAYFMRHLSEHGMQATARVRTIVVAELDYLDRLKG